MPLTILHQVKAQNNVEDQSWELKVCEKVSSQAARKQPTIKNVVFCHVGLSIALLNISILEVLSFCSAGCNFCMGS